MLMDSIYYIVFDNAHIFATSGAIIIYLRVVLNFDVLVLSFVFCFDVFSFG